MRSNSNHELEHQGGKCSTTCRAVVHGREGATLHRTGDVMMTKEGHSADEVSELLERGLQLYGQNKVDEAVLFWRRALALDPKNDRAKDFLECAGVPVEPLSELAEVIDLDKLRSQLGFGESAGTPLPPAAAASEESAPATESRPVRKSMIERLLRAERHEEALELLYQARAQKPTDAGLSHSIRILRERLALSYAAGLRNLDWVPILVDDNLRSTIDPQEHQVLALIDGISSYGDIVASSSLGRLSTLRLLCRLVERGGIQPVPPEASSRSVSAEFGASRLPDPDVTQRSRVSGERRLQDEQARGSSPPETSATTRASGVTQPSAVPQQSGVPPKNPVIDEYDQLFSEATAAYLIRDFRRATELFTECCRRRPNDRRAQHNLKALKRRVGST